MHLALEGWLIRFGTVICLLDIFHSNLPLLALEGLDIGLCLGEVEKIALRF